MKISVFTRFVSAYPEKIVFGVCLIIFMVVLAVYYLSDSEEAIIGQTNIKVTQVKKILDSNKSPTLPAISYLKRIENIWENIIPGQNGVEWLMYRQPVYEIPQREELITKTHKSNLPPVVKCENNSEEPDKLFLSWNKDKDSQVQIKRYKIYRQQKGEKIFNLVVDLAVSAISQTDTGYAYIDKGLKPETEYSYYLTSYTDDVDADRKESIESIHCRASTPADYKIEFKSVENDLVYTQIIKYFDGRWQKQYINIKKGESIGKDKFYTGCLISRIEPYDLVVESPMGKITKKTYIIFYIIVGTREEKQFIIP